MANEDGPDRDAPDELGQLLLDLARNGSTEEIQRAEAMVGILREARESATAPVQARLDQARREVEISNERRVSVVTAVAEGLRLHFEAYKNLTVLDSGALVAFAVVTHNLVPSPVVQSLLSAAYSFVFVSLVASLIMMFVVGERIFDVMRPDTSPDRGRVWRIVIRLVDGLALLAFVVGLGLFLQFLNVNL